jgi:hypothetical protein
MQVSGWAQCVGQGGPGVIARVGKVARKSKHNLKIARKGKVARQSKHKSKVARES